MANNTPLMIQVATLYGAETREALVSLTVAGATVDITPTEAREVALNLIAGAAAAESDAFIVEWMTATLDGDIRHGAAMLAEFRKWREAR